MNLDFSCFDSHLVIISPRIEMADDEAYAYMTARIIDLDRDEPLSLTGEVRDDEIAQILLPYAGSVIMGRLTESRRPRPSGSGDKWSLTPWWLMLRNDRNRFATFLSSLASAQALDFLKRTGEKTDNSETGPDKTGPDSMTPAPNPLPPARDITAYRGHRLLVVPRERQDTGMYVLRDGRVVLDFEHPVFVYDLDNQVLGWGTVSLREPFLLMILAEMSTAEAARTAHEGRDDRRIPLLTRLVRGECGELMFSEIEEEGRRPSTETLAKIMERLPS